MSVGHRRPTYDLLNSPNPLLILSLFSPISPQNSCGSSRDTQKYPCMAHECTCRITYFLKEFVNIYFFHISTYRNITFCTFHFTWYHEHNWQSISTWSHTFDNNRKLKVIFYIIFSQIADTFNARAISEQRNY